MRPEAKKYLFDIERAAGLIAQFATGKSFEDYASDPLLRSAIERQFEIVGEAMVQLTRLDVTVAEGISEHTRIIAFRNILAHGYAQVDDRLVWDVVESKLPKLRREIAAMLVEK